MILLARYSMILLCGFSEDSQPLHSKGKVFLLKEQVFHFLYRCKHKILRGLGLEKEF